MADVQDGRRDATAGQLLRAATPVLGQLILVGVVAAVGIMVGFILFVIPGLILLTLWSVAAPVVVIENPGVFPAPCGAAALLVRGNGLQVFAVILDTGACSWASIGNVIDALAASAGTGVGIVAWVVVGVLTAPLSALAAAVLYFELRARAAAPEPLDPRVSAVASAELLRPGLLRGRLDHARARGPSRRRRRPRPDLAAARRRSPRALARCRRRLTECELPVRRRSRSRSGCAGRGCRTCSWSTPPACSRPRGSRPGTRSGARCS